VSQTQRLQGHVPNRSVARKLQISADSQARHDRIAHRLRRAFAKPAGQPRGEAIEHQTDQRPKPAKAFQRPANESAVMVKPVKGMFDPKAFRAKVGVGKSISKFVKGHNVFVQGDVADAVFYIQKGRINQAHGRF